MKKPWARSSLTRRGSGKTIQMTRKTKRCRWIPQGRKRRLRAKSGISNRNLFKREKSLSMMGLRTKCCTGRRSTGRVSQSTSCYESAAARKAPLTQPSGSLHKSSAISTRRLATLLWTSREGSSIEMTNSPYVSIWWPAPRPRRNQTIGYTL